MKAGGGQSNRRAIGTPAPVMGYSVGEGNATTPVEPEERKVPRCVEIGELLEARQLTAGRVERRRAVADIVGDDVERRRPGL